MPPRSYYSDPRISDYIAFANAYFPDEEQVAAEFIGRTGLPYIASSGHLAAYIGVSPSLVRQIIHNPSYHYRQFVLKKSDGSDRLISTPKTYLKVIQWWVLDNILKNVPLESCVHGFRRGRSYVTNASMHLPSKHILNVDIKSFFNNIRVPQISNIFTSLGFPEGGSFALTALITKDGFAPTGAPTSPTVANLIFREADRELTKFSTSMGLIYTRYADDLTFSGAERLGTHILETVTRIVTAAGFELNPGKTKFMGPGDRQDVTGVVTNSELNSPKEWRNWARGYLHCVRLQPQEYCKEFGKIRGIYGILLQYDPDKRKPLTRQAAQTLALLREQCEKS